MSSLKSYEKKVFENLFDRDGYVLDFTNATFAEFFNEYNINIYDEKYSFFGGSKMKRLRAFWKHESDAMVGQVMEGLLEYARNVNNSLNKEDEEKSIAIICRLQGKSIPVKKESSEEDFLNENYTDIDLNKLEMPDALKNVIEQRLSEIQGCFKSKSPLSIIFLCGSTLEGLLLNEARKKPQAFNQSKSSPKDKGKARQLHDWNLQSLIDVGHEIGILSLDVKKFSHSLRNFRNYIHPYQQMVNNFNPDIHTAKISWQVLKAAIIQMGNNQDSGILHEYF